MGKPKVFKFSDPNRWHFCSNFSTLNCSTLNDTISQIKKINVRINFDLFTGMGNIFGHLESNKRVFGQNFQDVFGHNFDKVSEDDHLVFSISAFSKVEIRPFELLRFEQNSKKFIHGESGLKTYFKEVCLLDQAFIHEPSKTVSQVVTEAAKAAGAPVVLKGFVRYALGEGIQKQEADFAAEVASMSKG